MAQMKEPEDKPPPPKKNECWIEIETSTTKSCKDGLNTPPSRLREHTHTKMRVHEMEENGVVNKQKVLKFKILGGKQLVYPTCTCLPWVAIQVGGNCEGSRIEYGIPLLLGEN